MGTYCTVADVKEQIQITDELTDPETEDELEIEKRITEAEKWIDAYQDTTYGAPVPNLIKYAAACYAAHLLFNFLFTTQEPNQSNVAKNLKQRAIDYLDLYNKEQMDPESGLEKINSGFFE